MTRIKNVSSRFIGIVFPAVLILFFGLLLCSQAFADGWELKTFPSNKCVTYHQVFSFTAAGDTLYRFVAEPIPVASYDSATISVKESGTTPNFHLSSYLTNYNEPTDSTYWTLEQTWDTLVTGGLGKCVLKPVNKILYTKTSAGSFAYNIIVVKGLSGNTRNVTIDIAITYYTFVCTGMIDSPFKELYALDMKLPILRL